VPDRKTILVVGRNLFFLPRIQNVARPSGYDVKLTATASEFWDEYGESDISLVFVDLEGESRTWTAVVRGLWERVPKMFRIVAFGPHADTESLDLARELGCDAVLTKGEFSSGLRRIVETEGAELKVRG
jgi:CheY-like chemotaxis protein